MSAAANDDLTPLADVIAKAVKEAINERIPTLAAVGLNPRRYVHLHVASVVTGYTVRAMELKIEAGVWREGHEYRKAPDGRRLIDLEGYDRWVEGGRAGE